MSPKDYNEKCWPIYHRARGFIQRLDHAIEKSDGDAARQISIIGWNREVREHIIAALEHYDREIRGNITWELVANEIKD